MPAIHKPELTNLIKYSPDICKFIGKSEEGRVVIIVKGSSKLTPNAKRVAIPMMINTIPIANNDVFISDSYVLFK